MAAALRCAASSRRTRDAATCSSHSSPASPQQVPPSARTVGVPAGHGGAARDRPLALAGCKMTPPLRAYRAPCPAPVSHLRCRASTRTCPRHAARRRVSPCLSSALRSLSCARPTRTERSRVAAAAGASGSDRRQRSQIAAVACRVIIPAAETPAVPADFRASSLSEPHLLRRPPRSRLVRCADAGGGSPARCHGSRWCWSPNDNDAARERCSSAVGVTPALVATADARPHHTSSASHARRFEKAAWNKAALAKRNQRGCRAGSLVSRAVAQSSSHSVACENSEHESPLTYSARSPLDHAALRAAVPKQHPAPSRSQKVAHPTSFSIVTLARVRTCFAPSNARRSHRALYTLHTAERTLVNQASCGSRPPLYHVARKPRANTAPILSTTSGHAGGKIFRARRT